MYAQFHEAFLAKYFGYHVLARATRALEENTGDALFYIRILRKNFSPWFYLSAFTMFIGIRESFYRRPRSRVLIILPVVVLGLYTVIRTKIHWYIIPAYPALAILVAHLLVHAFGNARSMAFGGLVAGVFLILLFHFTSLSLVPLVSLTISVGFFIIQRLLGQAVNRSIVLSLCLFLITVGLSSLRSLYLQGEAPIAQLAKFATPTDPSKQKPLILYGEIDTPVPLFYSNRPIEVARTPDEVTALLNDHHAKGILLAKQDIESLSHVFEVAVLAESSSFAYATIQATSK
jgi:hypothetical protein